LQAVRRSLEAYFARVRPVCFLDDLTTKNLLIDRGAVSGVIDLDFVCYGDPLLSVGTTLAHLASLANGERYGIELLRSWNPQGDALRAVYFYASLWTLAVMRTAEAASDTARAAALRAVVETMLERAAGPKLEPATFPLSRCGSG
jgi:aminoglycoside phosphotransferase (APT) family kinase protein